MNDNTQGKAGGLLHRLSYFTAEAKLERQKTLHQRAIEWCISTGRGSFAPLFFGWLMLLLLPVFIAVEMIHMQAASEINYAGNSWMQYAFLAIVGAAAIGECVLSLGASYVPRLGEGVRVARIMVAASAIAAIFLTFNIYLAIEKMDAAAHSKSVAYKSIAAEREKILAARSAAADALAKNAEFSATRISRESRERGIVAAREAAAIARSSEQTLRDTEAALSKSTVATDREMISEKLGDGAYTANAFSRAALAPLLAFACSLGGGFLLRIGHDLRAAHRAFGLVSKDIKAGRAIDQKRLTPAVMALLLAAGISTGAAAKDAPGSAPQERPAPTLPERTPPAKEQAQEQRQERAQEQKKVETREQRSARLKALPKRPRASASGARMTEARALEMLRAGAVEPTTRAVKALGLGSEKAGRVLAEYKNGGA